ncbi:hypothetical protein PYW07_008094 [Mythimna separata]|uniref:Papilin n=1 Tax=Mythimna separata TaxID=271217 RepID=A0AAD8DUI4_MYTSE|nr:hypothetical protein PYW07_008094 [Mythimna separata]
MSRGCLLKLAALLVCARAYEDSESNPGITDDKNTAREVIGELDYPLKISCLASEKPPPFVFWSHKTRSSAWLIKDSEYEETGNTLLIRSLATETLGQYTCQVYSSKGLEAPRVFNVRAYRPDGDISGGEWLVPRDAVSPIPETTSIASWTTTEDLGETDKLELELAASEGDQITLHCLLDSTLMAGDPLPKVTWKFGGVTIDGTAGRYRVTSDGALQIVSLHRSDTGVYTCEPDDALGEASHDIHLLVNDPVPIPPGIAGEDNATVTGELDQPLHVRCLVYGYPNPSVLWSRDDEVDIVLFNNSIYEVTANILVIRSLSPDTLGPYTCQAFNEEGMASWRVVVQAYRPDGLLSGDLWFVPRDTKAPKPTTQASITTNKWLFTGSSIISKFTEVTKEVAASFDKSGDNTNNTSSTTIIPTISTTAVIGLSTLNDERTTSESSTTDEGSVTAEGTTDFLGTTTLDPCSDFQFGCCADNETEASGPEGQGCPCNTTEFGCCPDGVNPISGPDNEGCPAPCSTTPHGCCQDGKTPAHGPEFEGCCLLQAFGCCPDNRKPAEGPHLEGCGCQYALYGCCPDNVTIAQGPDHLGCGCQYTQHGCCLDRHTPASGPNKEGCACNTYQFGCCPDGITVAEGPDQLGCHCRDSKFGCCGDGETAATGPDAAGCDCSSSRYGCCPDGRTEAAGPKFLGCTDAPENKQAACSLLTDPGPCHNFTPMWYFDMAYGGCSRFWYGGCDGNGNRFSTKADCEDVCIQPSPKDACKLPSVKGACDSDYQRWHYNSTREQCIPFRYGGCLGNANNFDTRELCQKQCEPSSVAGQCGLPIDQGSCAGNYSRWGFNPETRRCEQFIWGGCEGNSNRFRSEAACQMRCAGTTPPECTQPQEAGNCGEKEALWSFSQSENRCLPFYYSGCGGNDNRFGSREACEQICPSAYDSDQMLPTDCTSYQQECEALDCPYGIDRFTQDECQRCECREDPCIRADCQPTERCEAVAISNPVSQEPEYSAKCVYENDVVHQCDEYVANCSRLRCEYGIQRTRQHDGCEQCSCVQVESDCEPLKQECTQHKCDYGIERVTGSDGCERCKCKEYLCGKMSCAAGERCVVLQYEEDIFLLFLAECRTILKAGACPMDETTTNEVTCRRECADDADCRGVGKCCRRGCSDVCLAPVEQTSPRPLLTTTTASRAYGGTTPPPPPPPHHHSTTITTTMTTAPLPPRPPHHCHHGHHTTTATTTTPLPPRPPHHYRHDHHTTTTTATTPLPPRPPHHYDHGHHTTTATTTTQLPPHHHTTTITTTTPLPPWPPHHYRHDHHTTTATPPYHYRHVHHTTTTTPLPPHHYHHTTTTTPLPPHHYHHTTTTTPLPPHHYHHTTTTTPLPPHHYHHTTTTTPLPPHHYHHTNTTTPLPPHHYHHTTTTTPLPPHQYHHTTTTTPLPPRPPHHYHHGHHTTTTTTTQLPPQHHTTTITTTTPLPSQPPHHYRHDHRTTTNTTAPLPTPTHHYHHRHTTTTTPLPPHHYHHTTTTTPLPPHHYHHTTTTTPLPPHHYHHTTTTTPLPPHHYHHTTTTTPLPPHHYHHTTTTTPLPPHHYHHTTTTTPLPPHHYHHTTTTTPLPPHHYHHTTTTTPHHHTTTTTTTIPLLANIP